MIHAKAREKLWQSMNASIYPLLLSHCKAFIRKHPSLRRLCQAEDLAQESYLAILDESFLLRGRNVEDYYQWAMPIAINRLSHLLRHWTRHSYELIFVEDYDDLQEPISREVPVEMILQAQEDHRLFRDAILSLPRSDGKIFRLVYLEKTSVARIAAQNGVSKATLYRRLNTLRERVMHRIRRSCEVAQ